MPMYSEKDLKRVKDNAAEYRRQVIKWNSRAKTALIGLALSVLLSVWLILLGNNIYTSVLASVVILSWLAVHIWTTSKANKFHQKQLIAERYVAQHTFDYKNIDNKEKN